MIDPVEVKNNILFAINCLCNKICNLIFLWILPYIYTNVTRNIYSEAIYGVINTDNILTLVVALKEDIIEVEVGATFQKI